MANVLPPVEVAFAAKGVKKLQDALRGIADSLLVIQQRSATGSVQEVIHHNNVAVAAQRRASIVAKSARASAGVFNEAQREALRLERATVDDAVKQDRKIRAVKIASAREVAATRRRELAGEDRDNARIAARSQADWKTKQTERRRMLSGEDRDNMAIARRAESDWRRKESGRVRAERMLAREVTATAKTSGVRGFLSGAASNAGGFSRYAGASSAESLGMGAAGLAVGAFGLFTSAISMATAALSQFGGFIAADLMSQMKLLTQTTQFANRLGGGKALAGDMRGTVTAWEKQYSSLTREQIMGTYGAAVDLTHDPKQAKTAANMALRLAHAYGEEPTKIAKVMGYARADLPGLNDDEFEAYSTQIMQKTLQKGSGMNIDEMSGLRDRIGVLSGRFVGSSDSHARAATEIGLTGLAAVGSVGRGGRFGTGAMDRLVDELSRNDTMKKISGDGTGQLRPLAPTIAALVSGAHGNLRELEAGSKEGKALTQYNMGGGYNKSSVDFLRALKVEETYRDAGGGKAGQEAVQALIEKIMNVSSKGDINAEVANVDETPEQQLNKILVDLKQSFYAMLPIIETSLIPALKSAAPQVEKMITAIAKMVAEMDSSDIYSTIMAVGKGLAEAIYAVVVMANEVSGSISDESMDALAKVAGKEGPTARKAREASEVSPDEMAFAKSMGLYSGPGLDTGYDRAGFVASALSGRGSEGRGGESESRTTGFDMRSGTAWTQGDGKLGGGDSPIAAAMAEKANEIGRGIGRGVSDWLATARAPVHPIGAGSREPHP